MPRQVLHRLQILEAIKRTAIVSELADGIDEFGEWSGDMACLPSWNPSRFKYELDLDVIVYGRNYNGKKVGPYVKLFVYEGGEEVIKQGDWGGNAFYVLVEGKLGVYVTNEAGQTRMIGFVPVGQSFGEASVLAGVPRDATVAVPESSTATVLEITRPALRLLRKLPRFGGLLDANYRKHGLSRTLEVFRQAAGGAFDRELLDSFADAVSFRAYPKEHVLFRQGEAIDRIVIMMDGWLRRSRNPTNLPPVTNTLTVSNLISDFLGPGNCLGLDGVQSPSGWAYTATVLQRAEVLEISVERLRANPKLVSALMKSFVSFQLGDDELKPPHGWADRLALLATEKEIETGLIDGTNLLVMDMDLCVRCGNCSLACHKVHGRSRLVRRGIHVERPTRIGSNRTQHVLAPAVCLHCQDPECLTGCPTGAIGRMSDGQIDIEPKTCIGCGDCAVQCPYNAISMIPRKAPAAAPQTWKTRARSWISLAPPVPPPEVTETEDLLAIKCNLCANTSLNPPNAKTQSYSCELNCPTGALARVNPKEYFAEAGSRVGPFSPSRPRGRRKYHRAAYLMHAAGAATVITTVALLINWDSVSNYFSIAANFGVITGYAGLVFAGFAAEYSIRKRIYRRNVGHLRQWRLAHAYSGVVALILLFAHSRAAGGGALTLLVNASLYLTIVSGLLWSACYFACPRLLTRLEAQPLLPDDLHSRRYELRQQLQDINANSSPGLKSRLERRVYRRLLSFRFLMRQYVRREELNALLTASRAEYEADLAAITDQHSKALFLNAVEAAVILRRVDSLIYLNKLLKLWAKPHVIGTVFLLIFTLARVTQIMWWPTAP